MPDTMEIAAPGVRDAVRPQLWSDILVTGNGRLRLRPLLAAFPHELAHATATPMRCHGGIDIVCLVLSGTLYYQPSRGVGAVVPTAHVAVMSTAAGVEYRWRATGDEPVHMATF